MTEQMKGSTATAAREGASREPAPRRGRARPDPVPPPLPVGQDEFRGSSRYELLVKIGNGGSAAVYIGRVRGSAGFSRLVAVKRAHAHLAHDPAVERMMKTEARLASGLNHANVVAVQDVEHIDGELLLILDYVEGASLAELLEAGALAGRDVPSRVAIRIAIDACAGLAAVHEIEGDDGRPVGFLHRDVSPQNILVGIDGTARITDFGLAKNQSASLTKTTGQLKGKLAYLAPEIIDEGLFSVRSDLFAMGVVVWESIARQRLFRGDSWADTVRKVGLVEPPPLSTVVPGLDRRLDGVVAKALQKVAARRYGSVREFLTALEDIAGPQNLIATSSEVSAYVRAVIGESLHRRRDVIRSIDAGAPVPNADAADEPSNDSSSYTDRPTLPRPGRQGPEVGTLRAALAPVAPISSARRDGSPSRPGNTAAMPPAAGPPARAIPGTPPVPRGAGPWQPAQQPAQQPVQPPARQLAHTRFGVATAPPAMAPRAELDEEESTISRRPDADDDEDERTLNRPGPTAAQLDAARTLPIPALVASPPPAQTGRATTLRMQASSPPVRVVPPPVLGARYPSPPPPPAHVSGALLRNVPRVELREVTPYGDDMDDDDAPRAPSAPPDDPSAPSHVDSSAAWAPPPPAVPLAPAMPTRTRRTAVLGAIAVGGAIGAAALLAIIALLLSPGSNEASAAGEPPAQSAPQSAPTAQPAAAQPAPKPAPTAAPGASTSAKPAALTPNALPDAPKGGSTLTPDSLPDAKSRRTR